MNCLMAQASEQGVGIGFVVFLVIYLGLVVFMIASMWKVFTKAGQPGWAILIPIYNMYIMLKIAGKPDWWLLLMFIPIVNIIVGIIAVVSLAANFGKGVGFAIGLILLPMVFYPILAFGDAKYMAAQA